MSRILWLISLGALVSTGCFKDTTELECEVDEDCEAGWSCASAECVLTRCLDSADCSDGLACRAGACVEPRACAGECDGTCDDGRCRACVTDSECGDGPCIIGRCFSSCAGAGECLAGETCHRGLCGRRCDEFDVCAALVNSSIELVASGERLQPRFSLFGCQLSAERAVDAFCDGELINSSDSQPRFCDPCLARGDGCGVGQTCVNGDCTCSSQADCPGTFACIDGYCAACGGDGDCDCDHYCSVGECLPACETDVDCGADFVCAAGRCASCRQDTDCGGSLRCYEDGCVAPCSESEPFCDLESGRSRFCELFSPIGESAVRPCE